MKILLCNVIGYGSTILDVSKGIPEEEIEKMLEEDLPDMFKGAPKQKEKAYITRQTIVLEGRHFFLLQTDLAGAIQQSRYNHCKDAIWIDCFGSGQRFLYLRISNCY